LNVLRICIVHQTPTLDEFHPGHVGEEMTHLDLLEVLMRGPSCEGSLALIRLTLVVAAWRISSICSSRKQRPSFLHLGALAQRLRGLKYHLPDLG
jgi:hypothetical protein